MLREKGPKMTLPLIDLTVQLHAKTDRAILISTNGERDAAAWVPLSQCEVEILKDGMVGVTLPEWLAIEKELV